MRVRFGLAMLAAVLALARAAVHAAPPAAAVLFQDPVFSQAQLAPDGRAVAMLVGAPGQGMRLAVLDLQTMKPSVVASYGADSVRSFAWVNDKRLVLSMEQTPSGPGRAQFAPGLFAVDADGGNYRQLVETTRSFVKAPPSGVPLLDWRYALLPARARAFGDDVFVYAAEENSREKVGYFKLLRLNTITGRSEEVDAPLHTVNWVLDAQGQVRAVLTRQANTLTAQLRQPSGAWLKVAEYERRSLNVLEPRFVGPDGTLYVSAMHGDKRAVFTIDTASGKRSAQPLTVSKHFDLHPSFIANEHKLLGLRYLVDAEVTDWIDPDMKALQDGVDAALPHTVNRLSVPAHGDAPWVLVQAFADNQPELTYVYNRQTKKLLRLGASHPGIDPKALGRADFIRYQARDGLEIPAYLTLPPGQAKKNLPLVVFVHGGPWVRGGSWRFDAEVQFLASRGYAVLEPEFRGSTGFGSRHFMAGIKQWGRAMQNDLADGARWAIAQGVADPKRICIIGASYGGYATLMGLANDPDLFRCGVNWAGVTDPQLMFSVNWSDVNDEGKRYGYAQLIGDPVADAAMLDAASPLKNAAKIKQPLLMAYGAWDVRVPLIHGEKFLAAVKPHNPNVEWVVYPDEGHGWYKPETRIDFWGRVEKFLARNMGPP